MNFEIFESMIMQFLEKARTGILATCDSSGAHARSMSIVNDGWNIYFQSNIFYDKHKEMQYKNKVALCINEVTFEGTIRVMGNWNNKDLDAIKEKYIAKHAKSYNAYGALQGQLVYCIEVNKVKTWRYSKEGVAFREECLPDIKYYKRMGINND